MALRLSSASNPSTVDGYIGQITDDTSISLAQKDNCLKTLAVVLGNMIDAGKGGASGEAGMKYRTLKLDNPKLQSRLFCANGVRSLLSDSSLVGMVPKNNTLVMTEAPSESVRDGIGLKLLPSLQTARADLATKIAASSLSYSSMPTSSSSSSTPGTNKKARLTEHNPKCTEKLSEKQKARRAMEEKKILEREQEKAFRKETRAKIAADKLVRQKDENWRPSVSAAADKTGTGLLSFRDRHGE